MATTDPFPTAAQVLASVLVASGIPLEHVEILDPELKAEVARIQAGIAPVGGPLPFRGASIRAGMARAVRPESAGRRGRSWPG